MSEWKTYKLGTVIDIHDSRRIPLSTMQREKRKGRFPYYGAQGIIDYIDDFIFEGEYLLIAEDGENLKSRQNNIAIQVDGQFWVNNHAHIVSSNVLSNQALIYYILNSIDLDQYITGSAQPKLNQEMLRSIVITLPSRPTQDAIAETLSSLDDKIGLLTRQNATLESLAQTYFRQWFTEVAEETVCLGDYMTLFDSKRIPLSAMERDKKKDGQLYPYYGAASIMDYINDYIFDGEYILLGEDGTVETDGGYPALQYATGKFWCNNHAHVIQAKAPYTNYTLWCFLKQCNISHIVTGAVQPKINQENLRSIELPFAKQAIFDKINNITDTLFKKILANNAQILTLQKLRDMILPKLISGEVQVKQ